MERETVIKALLFCRDIDKKISLNTRILQDYEDRYYNTCGGARLDGMPKSNYKMHSTTETAALNIPDSVSAVMRELQARNERLVMVKDAILQEINKLPAPQNNIIHDFYIRGLQWAQISLRVNYGVTHYKRIRNRALDNLAKRFTKTPLITDGILQ